MAKHNTLWKSYGMYSLEELAEEEQAVKEFLSECYPEIEQTEENVTQELYDHIDMYFQDELSNLNKTLDSRILAIANMGLWNGRRSGYKILGNNLNEILTCGIGCDDKEIYCDGFNVLAEGYHHDGTNYVEFRELKEDTNYEELLNKLYDNQPVTRAEIRKYTKSLLPYVKQIYGF